MKTCSASILSTVSYILNICFLAITFQDLSGMTAACIGAAEGENEVQDFEVGVFPRQYVRNLREKNKKQGPV